MPNFASSGGVEHQPHSLGSVEIDAGDAIDAILSSALVGDNIETWIRSVRHLALPLHDCRIVAVEHRKNKKGAEHEYLFLTMRCKGISSGKIFTRYIRSDRSFYHNSPGVIKHYRNFLRGGGLAADDTIIISPTSFRTGSYYHIPRV